VPERPKAPTWITPIVLDLRQIKYFVAVAEAGSFLRASMTVSTTQPALSRQIKRLERSLGVLLLYRHGRGVSLTAEGGKLLLHLKPILFQLEQLEQTLMKDRNAVKGEVTLGMPPSISGVISTPLLQQFRRSFPEASIRIIDGFSIHIHEWLITGRLDFAIYYAVSSSPGLTVEPLVAEDLYLFGPSKMKKPPAGATKSTISFQKLKGLPLILPARQHWLSRHLYREATRQKIPLQVEVELDAVPAIKDMVRTSGRYSIMTYGGIHAEVAAGIFKAYRIVDPVVEHTIVLATSRHHPITNATKEAIRLARQLVDTELNANRLRGRQLKGQMPARRR
jgi:LysR family nitrogen assimilation transcriptional regulator